MRVSYSSGFYRLYKKLSIEIAEQFKEKEKLFLLDPSHSSLKTHKLHGKLKRFWAFSVNNDLHVMFEFKDNNSAVFVYIGGHEIYKNFL